MLTPAQKKEVIGNLLLDRAESSDVTKGGAANYFDMSLLYGSPKPNDVYTPEDSVWLRDEIFRWYGTPHPHGDLNWITANRHMKHALCSM